MASFAETDKFLSKIYKYYKELTVVCDISLNILSESKICHSIAYALALHCAFLLVLSGKNAFFSLFYITTYSRIHSLYSLSIRVKKSESTIRHA